MPDYRLGKLKGRWCAVWYEGGKRKRWRLIAETPAAARAALQAFIAEHTALARGEAVTVGDIWADYVAEKEAQRKVSAGRMADAWKALAPTFAELSPASVSSAAVREYVAKRRNRVGDGTIHTELGYLRASLRFAVKAGRLASAPIIELPSKPRPRSRHLTPSEARRLLDAATMPHLRLYLLLALHTAGRPSSILDLEWDRVDFARRQIRLDNPGKDRTAKGRAVVPLAPQIEQPLKDAKKAALTGWVIEWAGRPIASIKKGVQRAAERAGLEGVTPYVLRHTAAVWMAEGGISMEEIAQYMGHTSPAVTFRTYARYSPEYQRKASDVISTVLHGGAGPGAVNGK